MSALRQDITQENLLVTREGLPISYIIAFTSTSVLEGVANGIWSKAALLVSDLVPSLQPSRYGPKDKMVKSKSSLALTWSQHKSNINMLVMTV